MVKGVIFDVDGVLLDSMPIWENLGELYLKRFGIPAESGLGDVLFTMSLEEGAEYLISHYDLHMPVQAVVEELTEEVAEFYENSVQLKEGVQNYLKELQERNIPMAIATSGGRKNVEAALKRLKADSYFQRIFTCSEVGRSKSWPDIYLAAAREINVEPGQTWVFEDSYHALCTAKKAGFWTAAVYDRANGRELGKIQKAADLYLSGFQDFGLFAKRAEL